MKTCSKCKIEKPLTDFYKEKLGKFGVRSKCKICMLEYGMLPKNKEIRKRYASLPENKEKKLKCDSIYRNLPENKEIRKQYDKLPEIIEKKTKYFKNRKQIDPLFKLSGDIRSLIGISLRKNSFKKTSKTAEILGCTFEEFKLHIEKQFADGMTWDNRELWHLDHIYPVSRAVDEQHLLQLNHYTNFQPLWAEDNLKKGNKILDNQSKILHNSTSKIINEESSE